jgi:hypothetical protein
MCSRLHPATSGWMPQALLGLMLVWVPFLQGVARTDSIPPAIVVFPLADTTVTFHWHHPENHRLIFLVIHDDENSSSEVGYATMLQYNASLLEMKNDNKYIFDLFLDSVNYRFNPNRVFSLNGIESALSQFGPCNDLVVASIDDFGRQVAGAFFLEPEFIVALHNNGNKGFSIKSYLTDSVHASFADSVFVNPKRDPDDFFYVNDPVHYTYLKNKGFNIVLQKTTGFRDDGSLSVWCQQRRIPYINIEAEHGHHKQQLEMLEAIKVFLPE